MSSPIAGLGATSSHRWPSRIMRALAAGVRGFLPKTAFAQVLADVLRTTHDG